ncbi:hypothetical protein PFICI_13271 [Pestalotiopsis fici W106-1]|uniref:Uncharacterized protein n=1 Tax=Pestalotiopsis fici (strain W106-1 / CGMCC3.15140) TaxID=1229662 RepID=W3WNU4_PESFW|nr:uncharacterized protein PFICI_13271 [Pestalotiopsis fici W106-1]ETS74787.1 hypothetical protein PFICI_13271 [Pestalotiopsis fici W106-1]
MVQQSGGHVSALDFPQVWQKPCFEELMACLKSLHIEPPVWGPQASTRVILENQENNARFRKEVAGYLSSIIKSDLRWLGDSDDEREAIWDEASRRLSERCGRAGMGEITRRWPFTSGDSATYPDFELIIREPSITGDCLGFKTWGSSYFLAGLLDQIAARSLSHLLPAEAEGTSSSSFPDVLELGSGTGLCGMAAAAIWKTRVTLSDLPEIVPNLSHNIETNRQMIESLGGTVEAGALTWGGEPEDDDELFSNRNQFKILLAADPIYDDDHPALLASAVRDHLSRDANARVVAMVPLRDNITRRLLQDFKDKLAKDDDWPLTCLEEHSLMGQDDWGDDDDEKTHIECWWGVFGSSAAR